jgi:small subunit ribosomal protein S17
MEKKYPVRGVVFEGIVIKQKTPMTCVVKRSIVSYIPKYERSLIKTAKYAVHIPENMKAEVGDLVLVGETRKISKTKNFVITKLLKKGVLKE